MKLYVLHDRPTGTCSVPSGDAGHLQCERVLMRSNMLQTRCKTFATYCKCVAKPLQHIANVLQMRWNALLECCDCVAKLFQRVANALHNYCNVKGVMDIGVRGIWGF